MSDATIGERLARPFHLLVLKTKPGQGGRELIYVPSHIVIERLNEVLRPGGWSWRILHHEREGDTVMVWGELVALDRAYTGEDGAEIAQRKGGGQTLDALANAWKSASSGALVRAARLLGVGLYLYRGGSLSEVEGEKRDRPQSPGATAAQFKELKGLMKSLSWTAEQMKAAAGGRTAALLTMNEAKTLIADLRERLPKQANQGQFSEIARLGKDLEWSEGLIADRIQDMTTWKGAAAAIVEMEALLREAKGVRAT